MLSDLTACWRRLSRHSLVRPLAEPFFRPDPQDDAAVKDGRILRPPGGLVLDGREHDGRLVRVGIDRQRVMPALVVDW